MKVFKQRWTENAFEAIVPMELHLDRYEEREASAAPEASLCAGHAQQFGGASPPANLMEVKA